MVNTASTLSRSDVAAPEWVDLVTDLELDPWVVAVVWVCRTEDDRAVGRWVWANLVTVVPAVAVE
jgi:hypothetical protein